MPRSASPLVIVLLCTLSGCAGTQGEMRLLENDGAIRIEPSHTAGANYDVTMRNLTDLVGFHPDDPENRNEYALRIARPQCPNARIVGEDKIETGTYLLGNPSRTFIVHIKC